MRKPRPVKFEFHIKRQARDLYDFGRALFSLSGNATFSNFHAARQFAQKMNKKRDLISFPENVVRAGQVNAMGLIDEILHFIVNRYRQEENPIVIEQALSWLYEQVGKGKVDQTLRVFIQEFPPLAVYLQELSVDEYLKGESTRTDGTIVSNKQIILEEMILLWLANVNPAFSPFLELFDHSRMVKETAYQKIIEELHDFFDRQPTYGPDHENLIDMLQSPAVHVPHSLSAQLEYIRSRWGYLLGDYLFRLLSSLDFIKEEEKASFLGPGPSRVYDFSAMEAEAERFTPDRDWMPSVVLIAKNIYVWLDQLSKQYGRKLEHLDDIPDEELSRLSQWGITGLWLIGLWERSPASRRIKQMRGNPEAVASAYSIFDYYSSGELGGEDAYQKLRDRAWKHGIRLSADMVPNHMGVDSRWVIEHPDRFIHLNYSPFPSYTFNGPNLSWDERVGIYLEDHYYEGTDAAVVFKRVDNWTGDTRYIYHGNDGTSMPWNDTAQLNFLNEEVRETVIQTILEVARKFSIIRFDAAMTLAKKHYQRLWFPEPGGGGAIPSRAEHGLTREDFNRVFPEEFWRQVVDRIAREQPDTLLLAEAFWLMEGYFVRTLGMHRVYNSAFMNMLRDEKNQEYRLVIKNTLEFDPEILKRYVNFMNNPDERTAVDQFGKGDKYFGICTLMATMPGLPMFGHGQVEGYAEKYGMEYKRAYWDEIPDAGLVERHEREIFPLLRRRRIFAEAENFLLYDFYTQAGYVNEDVFAYSNRSGDERALVLFHNRYADTRGWLRLSTPYPEKSGQNGDKQLVQRTLGQGLNLTDDPGYFTIFRDHTSGLEYIRNNRELHEKGLFVELEAYKYRVFLDFRQVQDTDWHQYAQLASYLESRGVPNIEEALQELFLQPVHQPFRELFNPGQLRWLIDNRASHQGQLTDLEPIVKEVQDKAAILLVEIKKFEGGAGNDAEIAQKIRSDVLSLLTLPEIDKRFPALASAKFSRITQYIKNPDVVMGDLFLWCNLLGWTLVHRLGKVSSPQDYAEQSRSWIDEWLLGKIMAHTFQDLGLDEDSAWRAIGQIKFLISHQDWWKTAKGDISSASQVLQSWLYDGHIQQYLGVNRYQGVLWYNQERYEALVWWMFIIAVIQITSAGYDGERKKVERISACYRVIEELLAAESESNYRVDKLMEAVS
jgi:glycosidase